MLGNSGAGVLDYPSAGYVIVKYHPDGWKDVTWTLSLSKLTNEPGNF